MKLLKILTCSLFLAGSIWCANSTFGQNIERDVSARLGFYDFTDQGTREFYGVAPSLVLEGDVIRFASLVLRSQIGIAYTTKRYNGRRHHLGLIPFNVTGVYEIEVPESKLKPYIGMGMGLYYKWNNNSALNKSNDYFTYGYLVNLGVQYRLYADWLLLFDVRYNHAVQTSTEEFDISGIQPTIGVRIPIRKSAVSKSLKEKIRKL